MKKGSTSLILAKQNFKFSSAHFLIFDSKRAEKLHGHNYEVQLQVGLPPSEEFTEDGYHVDFRVFKTFIKDTCDALDEHVLLPSWNEELKTAVQGESLEVLFRERRYVFPKNEVLLLPMTNTSVEQLSKYLTDLFALHFAEYKLQWVEISVAETQGQAAKYRLDF